MGWFNHQLVILGTLGGQWEDFIAGGAPCALLTVFGGSLDCARCWNECVGCSYKMGPTPHSSISCASSWCSIECLELWETTLHGYSAAMYELLCQPVSTRDYIFRAVVASMDPWPYLEEVKKWRDTKTNSTSWVLPEVPGAARAEIKDANSCFCIWGFCICMEHVLPHWKLQDTRIPSFMAGT